VIEHEVTSLFHVTTTYLSCGHYSEQPRQNRPASSESSLTVDCCYLLL